MDYAVRTQTKTSVKREGNQLTVKEVETTTITRKGQPPEVKTVEKVKIYDINNLPNEIRQEFSDLLLPDNQSKAVKKKSSLALKQGSAETTQKPASSLIASYAAASQNIPADLKKLNDDCVKCHNAYRSKHGVGPLTHDPQLAQLAQDWAEHLAKHGKFEHRRNNITGENLYMYYSSNPEILATAQNACDSWYSEIKYYVFGKEPASMKSGHFTQMIWKETQYVGMGRARCPSGKQIIVANYNPPGNFIGAFTENVPRPL